LLLHFSYFPFQASLNHLFNNGNTILLRICYLILGMVAFLVHIKLFFPFCPNVANCFHLSCMFVKHVNKSWQNVDPFSKDHLWISFCDFFLSWLDSNLWCLVVPIATCIVFCKLFMHIASLFWRFLLYVMWTPWLQQKMWHVKKIVSYLFSSSLVAILTMHLLWWSHLNFNQWHCLKQP
jgi:hypothetical protein